MTSTSEPPTPLCKASFDGDLDSVASLLASGVDYLESDDTGETALHWAVAGHHLPVVEMLLGHHRPSTQEPAPITTLTYQDLMRLARKTRPVVTPIELAAQLNNEAIFKSLLNCLEPFADTVPVFNGVWPPLSTIHRYLDEACSERCLAKNDNLPSRNEFDGEADWWAKLTTSILHLAIKDSKFPVVEMVLRVGANPNGVYGQGGHEPLDVAAYCQEDPAYIRLLLKHGANPNPERTGMQTPLSMAMGSWNEGAVTALLEGGASPNAPNGVYSSHMAKLFSLIPTRKLRNKLVGLDTSFILRTFGGLVDAGAAIDLDFSTDVMFLVMSQSLGRPFLKVLVARGADLTSCNFPLGQAAWGTTLESEYHEALEIFAAAYGTQNKLRDALLYKDDNNVRYDLALGYGLDADGPMDINDFQMLAYKLFGHSPLLGHLETLMESAHGSADLPIDFNSPLRSLFRGLKISASTPDHLESFMGVLRVLDQAGAIDPAGVTGALFDVVKNYNGGNEIERIVEGLLDLGAEICNPDSAVGWPWKPDEARFSDALALSAIHGRETILSVILQRLPQQTEGSHPSWPAWFRQEEFNSLRLMYNNNIDTVLACLESSNLLMTPNLADEDSPLLVAIHRGDVRAVRTLIALGVNINQEGNEEWPPLHTAAEGGHEAIVDVLLQANASVNAQTRHQLPDGNEYAKKAGVSSKGGTALHLAAIRGHLRIIEKLLSYGADVHAKTSIVYPILSTRTTLMPGTALDLVLLHGPVVPRDRDTDKSIEWLHPDRLSAALLLVEKGARFSKAIAERWKSLKLDEVLEKFEGRSSLWDMVVGGQYDYVEEEPLYDDEDEDTSDEEWVSSDEDEVDSDEDEDESDGDWVERDEEDGDSEH
ncbi:hypothetical protein BKA70DRAFT_1563852 [Coprinopsis sp. MPI-PUGE-AT-0042]|nr:hypothetical protein BKA70DRAFT_1563852 [Coprinopsis sp. MPI-PUGE-AT-0042]